MRRVLQGIGAVGGIGVGPAVVVGPEPAIVRRRVGDSEVHVEQQALRDAVEAVRAELDVLRAASDDGEVVALVLDAHRLLLSDELLFQATLDRIETEHVGAAWAVSRTAATLVERLGAVGSPYLRDRVHDVRQVTRQVIERLHPTAERRAFELAKGSVLVAHDVSPADAVRLGRSKAVAIVTEVGSPSGHTALVARTFGMIALVGVRSATHVVAPGDVVVVDALDGHLIVRADDSEARAARQRGEGYRAFSATLRQRSDRADNHVVATSDGESVHVQANLELAEEVTLAAEAGADGIGLYRTEFFYLGMSGPPSEEAQFQAYSHVVRTLAPLPVTIRTYDLGADKLPGRLQDPGWLKDRGRLKDGSSRTSPTNPALGLRALRFSLAEPDLFRAQLRAICRAAALGPVRIMFPMVTTAGELRQAIDILRDVESELDGEGVNRGAALVGAMIEVPAAALSVRRFVPQVSFLSVGTNDLVQYTLAVDRSDATVAHLADPLDPAHLRLLGEVAEACSVGGIDVAMCGNMAADLVALPIVLGLGYRTLSVPCAVVPLTKAAVQLIDASAAADAAERALELEAASDVRSLVRYRFGPTIGELWRRSGVLDARDRRPSSKPPPT